jgi:hypothetical protein
MRLLRSGKADVNESHIGLAVHPLVNPYGQKIETAERTEAVASLPRRLRVTERISAA